MRHSLLKGRRDASDRHWTCSCEGFSWVWNCLIVLTNRIASAFNVSHLCKMLQRQYKITDFLVPYCEKVHLLNEYLI